MNSTNVKKKGGFSKALGLMEGVIFDNGILIPIKIVKNKKLNVYEKIIYAKFKQDKFFSNRLPYEYLESLSDSLLMEKEEILTILERLEKLGYLPKYVFDKDFHDNSVVFKMNYDFESYREKAFMFAH